MTLYHFQMRKISAFLCCLVLLATGCGRQRATEVNSLDDLAYARVAVLMGSTHDKYMSDHFPQARILRMDVEADLYMALDKGTVDAIVADESGYLIGPGRSGRYKVVGTNYTESFGIGFSLNNTALRDRFNAFLKEIRAGGKYDDLYEKWFADNGASRMPEWNDTLQGPPLRLGCAGTMEGFAFVRDGRASGFDVELLERFAHAEGRPFEVQYINFGGLIAALTSGKVDAIASGITITEERSQSVAFSDPYFESRSVTIVPNGGKVGGYATLEDAASARFAVITGNLHDKYVTDNMPHARVMRYDTYADVMMSLEAGNADVACVEGVVYEVSQKKTGKYEVIGTLFDDPYGFGFNKKDPVLRDQFNAFLKDIRTDGVYDQIDTRWIKHPDTARMPLLGPEPQGKPLRVGCTGATDVFDFYRDNRNAGFDIELAERFGRSIGRPVKFVTMNFGSLIAALSSGTVDVIASAITINAERARQIDFSDPYYVSQSLAIVMKERYARNAPVPAAEKSLLLRTVDDLKRKRIGVLMGSIQDEYIAKIYPEAQILRIDLVPDLVMALKTRQCDAIVVTGPDVRNVLRHNSEMAVLDPDIYGVDFGMGFRDEAMRDRFNLFIIEIRGSGLMDRIHDRWMDSTDVAVMPDLKTPAGAKPLVVGTTGANVPFTFMRGERNCGFDIEIAERFAASEGRPVEYKLMTFGALIPSLQTGRIDMMANFAMLTEDRKKQAPFSDSYYHTGSAVIVHKADMAVEESGKTADGVRPVHDGSDLATARVATMTGTTSELFIEKEYPGATLLGFDDINDAFLAVVNGKADYVFTSYTTSLLATKNIGGLVLLPEEYIRDPAAIAINKKDTDLLHRINEVLLRYKEDGTMQDIIARWIRPDGSDYIPAEIPAVTEGKVLRVGVAANREPMCFISNGRVSGLDIELIERIAYDLGRPIEYSDMKFSSLIAAIESGKVDLVISNFSVTPERQKKVNFSESYFTNPQMLVTRAATETGVERKNWFGRVGESFYNNLILEKRYMLVVRGLWQTLLITFFAALLGTVLGGVVCGMRMSRNRLLCGTAKGYINIVRGTPVLVLLMILFYVVFASTGLSATVVAIITFALNMAAYSSEMFRTSIQSVDRGQKEAGIALGFTKTQTFINIILPQAVRTVLPVYKGEVISMLKMTSVVGYIAVVDLTKASDIIRSRTFDAFFPLILVAVIYFLIAWLIGLGLDYLNKKIPAAK